MIVVVETERGIPIAYVASDAEAKALIETITAYFERHGVSPEYGLRSRRTREHEGELLELPEESIKYGTALDLRVELAEHHDVNDKCVEVDFTPDAADGWLMLTTPDAFDLQPGDSALYLVRGELSRGFTREDVSDKSAENYQRWHKRPPVGVRETSDDLPAAAPFYMGEAITIGYRSDKWRERDNAVDYTHDFLEGDHEPPEVWADVPDFDKAQLIVVTGGTMSITEEGID